MGLAASQARMLFITARKSDVEFSEMKIASDKMSLSRESEDISDAYSNSLNMRKLTFALDGSAVSTNTVDLSYELLMSPNSVNVSNQYMITDNNNRVVLSDDYCTKLGIDKSSTGGALGMDLTAFLAKFQLKAPTTSTNITSDDTDPSVATKPKSSMTDVEAAKINSLLSTYTTKAIATDRSTNGSADAYTAIASEVANQLSSVNALISPLSDSTTALTSTQTAQLTQYTKERDALTKMNQILNACSSLVTNNRIPANSLNENTITNLLTAILKGTEADSGWMSGVTGDHNQSGDCNAWLAANGIDITANFAKRGTWISGHDGKISFTPAKTSDGSTYSGPAGALTAARKGADGSSSSSTTDDTTVDLSTPTTDTQKITFYTNLYNAIAANGWSRDSNVSNTSYLSNQLINNNLHLDKMNSDGTWSQSSLSDPSSPIRNVRDTDGAADAKTKYDLAKGQIDDKETQLDLQMKSLETERSALDTEIDSVKGIISKNIERSFKTFA